MPELADAAFLKVGLEEFYFEGGGGGRGVGGCDGGGFGFG